MQVMCFDSISQIDRLLIRGHTMWIRSHLVKYQRPEQPGFTPGKSTTNRILALCIVLKHRHEFRQGMLAASVNLKKVFDSVHREAL